MNVSSGLRRLEITKKRSFCYRTKVSDWFRPMNETNSSKAPFNSSKTDLNSSNMDDESSEEGELKIDEPESALIAEKRASEMRMLKNFYKQPTKDQSSSNLNAPSAEDCFEVLNKFKESLKRKTVTLKRVHVNKESNSSDVTQESKQNPITDTNAEKVSGVENSCSDGEIIEKSNTNVDGEADAKVPESSNANSVQNAEPSDNSECEKSEIDRVSDGVPEKIDIFDEVESRESCSIEQNALVDEAPEQTALEKEHSAMFTSNNNSADESALENNIDIDCTVHFNSESTKAGKENLNHNRVQTLSSLAARLKQSKTPKRTTPASSSRYSLNSLSASKKFKISDYFSPKSQ